MTSLESRIQALKQTEQEINFTELTEEERNIPELNLTEQEIEKLNKGVVDLIQISNDISEEELSQMSPMDHIREISNNFTESFPNYDDKTIGIFNNETIKKILKTFSWEKQSEDKTLNLKELLAENGILKSLDILRQNPNSKLNIDFEKDGLSKYINNLDSYLGKNLDERIFNLLKDNENKYIQINKENILDNIETFLEYSKKSIDIIKDNSTIANLGLGALGGASLIFSYRLLIKNYANALYGNSPDIYNGLNQKQKIALINARVKHVRFFSIYAAPVIIAAFAVITNILPSRHQIEMIVHTSEINQSNIDKSEIANALLFFTTKKNKNKINKNYNNKKSNKNFNWWKIFKISIFIIIFISLVLKYIFNIEDSNNFIVITINFIRYYIIYYTKYITIVMFIWCLVIYLYMLFKYLKLRYFYEIEFKNISKYWPKIIKDEIDDFNRVSKMPDLKEILVNINFKSMIIYSIMFIFYLCIFYYLLSL